MGWSSRCYISSFVEIDPPVPKKIFKGFTIYGYGGHLGHVTSIMSSNFHCLVPESFLTKFGSEVHSSFRENPVLFFVVHNLGPRSRNDLNFQYSFTFMNTIRCLLQ